MYLESEMISPLMFLEHFLQRLLEKRKIWFFQSNYKHLINLGKQHQFRQWIKECIKHTECESNETNFNIKVIT